MLRGLPLRRPVELTSQPRAVLTSPTRGRMPEDSQASVLGVPRYLELGEDPQRSVARWVGVAWVGAAWRLRVWGLGFRLAGWRLAGLVDIVRV